jgi:pyrimidine operon attenuation protein/uracil phosphoribosyltransferase
MIEKEILDGAGLERVLKRLAHEIAEKNDGLENVALIGIRTRGVIVAERIREQIEKFEGVSLPLGILDITLYRDDILSCDAVVKGTQIDFDIAGKTLVLCDDVLYTGRTVRAAISALTSIGNKMGRAGKIQLLEVVDRGHRELPFRADFIGKNIPTAKKEKIIVRFQETDGEDGVVLVSSENVD